MKKIKSIAEDTPLVPHIVADIVAGEAETLVRREVLRGLRNHLVGKAESTYLKNTSWRKKIRGRNGREYLYSFMRHWAAAWMLNNGIRRGEIPTNFANGQYVATPSN